MGYELSSNIIYKRIFFFLFFHLGHNLKDHDDVFFDFKYQSITISDLFLNELIDCEDARIFCEPMWISFFDPKKSLH